MLQKMSVLSPSIYYPSDDSEFILDGIEEFFLQGLPPSSLPPLSSPQPP